MGSEVLAGDLSVQLKRTNPGIAQYKSAELVYDIVNMDTEHKIEGFILCAGQDGITVSSINGFSSGSGAQYISPKFIMDEGPSQKAVSLVIEANTKGDYNTKCTFKYVPFIETDGVKSYQKTNLEYTNKISDSIYRGITLDKTVPFAGAEVLGEVYCPSGVNECNTNTMIIREYITQSNVIYYLLIAGLGLIILILFGKLLKHKN